MAVIDVFGSRPVHRVVSPYPLLSGCGLPAVANKVRKAEISPRRHDLCRVCFPAPRERRLLRLGRHQRLVAARALASRDGRVYLPRPKREREALYALTRRGILIPVPGLPLVHQIASGAMAARLKFALMEHVKG